MWSEAEERRTAAMTEGANPQPVAEQANATISLEETGIHNDPALQVCLQRFTPERPRPGPSGAVSLNCLGGRR